MAEWTYSIPEFAKKAGISVSLAYQLARKNKLPGQLKCGQKRVILSKVAVDKWLQGEMTIPAGEKAS